MTTMMIPKLVMKKNIEKQEELQLAKLGQGRPKKNHRKNKK